MMRDHGVVVVIAASAYAPYIMTFLSPGDMGRAAMAASMFREAAWRDPEYCDVSLMGVEQSFEAHDDYVEALVYRHPGMLYSCGDRRCKLWDLTTGEHHHQQHSRAGRGGAGWGESARRCG